MSRRYRIPKLPPGDGCYWIRCLFDINSNRAPAVARAICTSSSSSSNNTNKPAAAAGGGEGGRGMTREEAYNQLQNLDFTTAAKILFTAPPKREKFGLDFHLVQLFFVCMPSLAVFLVAQYARYEIRRMEAEVELKKKKDEEEKAKEAEKVTMEEAFDPELVKVRVRLEALEEAVKEIVDEKKKIPQGSLHKDQATGKEEPAADSEKKWDSGEVVPDKNGDRTGASGPATDFSQQDGKKAGRVAENGVKPSQELKK